MNIALNTDFHTDTSLFPVLSRNNSRRKSHAKEEKVTHNEDNDPLGLGIIEKRVLVPPTFPGKRTSPDAHVLNKFSSVSDLAGIKVDVTEDSFSSKPGKIL